jgi:hypothetical protein
MKYDARKERMRRARELALAICAGWLVLQNVILLATVPWPRWAAVGIVPLLAVGAGACVAGTLWLLPLAALMGWRRERREVRHD